MATTPSIVNNLAPKIFDGNSDLEDFIGDCQRFFEVCQINESIQMLMVKAFIGRDLLATYEAVDSKIVDFAERLRKAFKKPTSLIQDLQDLMTYRKGSDSAPAFFNKVEKMVDKILNHKWNKQELMSYFLTHCVEDVNMKTQILIHEAKSPEAIKSVIEKMETIKSEVEVNEIANIQRQKTFANVLKARSQFPIHQSFQNQRSNPSRNFKRYATIPKGSIQQSGEKDGKSFVCYHCRKSGHIRRDCPEISRICYGWCDVGHI